jgi:hypothetical protein
MSGRAPAAAGVVELVMPAGLWVSVHFGVVGAAAVFAAMLWPPDADPWRLIVLAGMALSAFAAAVSWAMRPSPPVLVRADAAGLHLRYRFADRYLDVPWRAVRAVRAESRLCIPSLVIELESELPNELRQAMALYDNGPRSPVFFAGQGQRLPALTRLAARMEALRPADPA